MYTNAVVSSLGAWRTLQSEHETELQEIFQSIAALNEDSFSKEARRYVRPRRSELHKPEYITRYLISSIDVSNQLSQELSSLDWHRNIRIVLSPRRFNQFITVDFVKDGIGIEVALDKVAFLESKLFTGFPYLIQSNVFRIPIVLIPMMSLARKMSSGIGTFESVAHILTEMRPLPLRYPFAIIGFSSIDTDLDITELTTDLDQFLIRITGKSLYQMSLDNESPGYDFKEILPDNKKMAQEICAFANLSGGGIILLGVNNSGNIVGINRGHDLDDLQLQIINISSSSCIPPPKIDFHVFDAPGKSDKAILAVQIHELERKPCMTQDRVYVRIGPSARPAKPEEIRRLVLG